MQKNFPTRTTIRDSTKLFQSFLKHGKFIEFSWWTWCFRNLSTYKLSIHLYKNRKEPKFSERMSTWRVKLYVRKLGVHKTHEVTTAERQEDTLSSPDMVQLVYGGGKDWLDSFSLLWNDYRFYLVNIS